MNLSKTSIITIMFVTMLEYYDYAIFNFFLPIIAPIFFPASSRYKALSIGFYAILICAIARPIGGVIFGYIGDKFGRKIALVISAYGIACSTLLLGVMPGYLMIGAWSIVMIITIRLIQTLCYGGEYSGAGIYVVELANGVKEGAVGGMLAAIALMGSVVASIVGMVLTYIDRDTPHWRLAFILGAIIGAVGIMSRRNMKESISLDKLKHHQTSLLQLFRTYPSQIFVGICIGGFITLPFTTVLTFINPILLTRNYLTYFQFMTIQFILSIIAVIVLLLSGIAADKYTPKKIMQIAAIGLIILSLPLSFMLNSQKIGVILFAEIVLIIINEMLLGPSNAYLKSIFPCDVRYRGSAFSFCLGMAIVGGLTPVVENFLFIQTGTLITISLWLILLSCLTLLSLNKVKLNYKAG